MVGWFSPKRIGIRVVPKEPQLRLVARHARLVGVIPWQP